MLKRSLLAVLLVSAAAPAFAAPTLRPMIRVSSDIVTLGDLVEDAGPFVTTPVYRAPDLGTTGSVPVKDIVDRARIHGLVGIKTGNIVEVVVTRAAIDVTPDDYSTRLAAEIAPRLGTTPDALELTFDIKPAPTQADAAAKDPVRILDLGLTVSTGRFDALVQVDKGGSSERIRLRGQATEMVDVVMLARAFQKGDVVHAGDLTVQRMPKKQANRIGEVDAADLVGKAARRPLRPGIPVATADFGTPLVVKKGDLVTLVVEGPGLMLTVRGQAQESGAVGDQISILNEQSKRVVHGQVAGPGKVTVGSTLSRLASIGSTEQ